MSAPRVASATAALAAAAVILWPAAAQAASGQPDEPIDPVPGVTLPTGVQVIAGDEGRRTTGTTSDEVVVSVAHAEDGSLEVLTLEAPSPSQAAALTRQLDSLPGVTAEPNQSVAAAPETIRGGSPTAGRSGAGRTTRAAAVPTLGQEARGAELWGMSALNVDSAWSLSRGASVIVAVLDSGVDPNQPDLAGRLLPQVDMVGDGATGDPFGHGTHVAGTIAAAADGNGVVGVAPEARILPVRVLGSDGTGTLGWAAQGIVKAVDSGAKVINLSLTSAGRSKAAAAAVKYAVSRGVTVVAAAGNDYQNGNPTEYPAALPGVLGVAAVGRTPSRALQPAPFSSSGTFVDLAAPGTAILSSLSGSAPGSSVSAGGARPVGYGYSDGTSMASPHVAGVAALIRSTNPRLSKQQVDQVLLGTAQDITDVPGWDPRTGYGLVRADLAVATASDPARIRATARAYAVNRGGDLRVDVDPDRSGGWRFSVQRRTADGWAKVPGSYQTRTTAGTRTIKLPAGTYRVVVSPRHGFAGSTTEPLTLTR